MSAMRYSGDVRVRVTYVEPRCGTPAERRMMDHFPHGQYRCYVHSPADRRVIWVGARIEHGSGVGVDSPAAFDSAARAAIAFAEDESRGCHYEYARFEDDLSDITISRRPMPLEPGQ